VTASRHIGGPDRRGRLVLVATPIGNLGDLSPRAVAVLASAALVCCEDTRRTGRLLAHAGVSAARLAVANDHTERARIDEVLAVLAGGGDVAVVTDAGTPGIADPGERLVRAAIEGGHQVLAVPGPAAVVAALILSGMPTQRFVMEGFLPRRGRERSDRLAEIAGERRTIVLYEAPHRLRRTLDDLVAALGRDRPVAVSRELTKLHEETWRGTLADAAVRATTMEPRGEHVLVVAGAPPVAEPDDDGIRAALADRTAAGDDRKTAIARVVADLGVPKRRVYALAHDPVPVPERPPEPPVG
jgi:16S rRNA (cytidine1402-2'-O)-methyltransferase